MQEAIIEDNINIYSAVLGVSVLPRFVQLLFRHGLALNLKLLLAIGGVVEDACLGGYIPQCAGYLRTNNS